MYKVEEENTFYLSSLGTSTQFSVPSPHTDAQLLTE